MSKAKAVIDSMMNSDMVLYEKILDTPGFAFHFNELVKIALIEHGPEVSRECIEYLTKIEKRTQDIIEWLEEPWDDPNAVIDEMTIRLKRLLQDTRGRR